MTGVPGGAAQLWAASFSGKIFSSSDAAQTWHPSSLGVTDPVVTSLAVSPDFASDKTLLAAADEGVFRSTDAGESWTLGAAGLDHHFCRAVLFSPGFSTDRTVFVATDSGVYTSHDAGSTWAAPSSGAGAVISLTEDVDAAGTVRLYAGLEDGGLEMSTDNAVTWTTAGQFPAQRRALAMTTLPGGRVLVGTDAGIWLSSDADTTWSLVGAPNDRIDTLATDVESTSTRLYAGSASGNGVYVSTDNGLDWTRTGAPGNPYVTALGMIAGGTQATLAAGTAGGGVSLSTDGGASWQTADSGLNAFSVSSMIDVNGSTLVGGNGGLFIRDNETGAWKRTVTPSTFVTSVDGSGSTLFAGTQDAGLQRSFDFGATWSRTSLAPNAIETAALSPDGKTLIAAADYVYVSRDQGTTFERAGGMAGNDVRSFCFSSNFASDSTVFAATINHGLYKSVNAGFSWSPAGTVPGPFPTMQALTSPTFSTDQVVYAATAGGGIYRSSDGGTTWSAMPSRVPDAVVDTLAWSPSGQLMAGTEHGVFALGASGWENVFPGWDGYVSTLAYDSSGAVVRLFVGTTGDGVWEWDSPNSAVIAPSTVAATVTATPTPARRLTAPLGVNEHTHCCYSHRDITTAGASANASTHGDSFSSRRSATGIAGGTWPFGGTGNRDVEGRSMDAPFCRYAGPVGQSRLRIRCPIEQDFGRGQCSNQRKAGHRRNLLFRWSNLRRWVSQRLRPVCCDTRRGSRLPWRRRRKGAPPVRDRRGGTVQVPDQPRPRPGPGCRPRIR